MGIKSFLTLRCLAGGSCWVSFGGLTVWSCCSFLLHTINIRCGGNKGVKITFYSLPKYYTVQKNRGADRRHKKTQSLCFNQGLYKGNVRNESGFSGLKIEKVFKSFKYQGGPDREVLHTSGSSLQDTVFKLWCLQNMCVYISVCALVHEYMCICAHGWYKCLSLLILMLLLYYFIFLRL